MLFRFRFVFSCHNCTHFWSRSRSVFDGSDSGSGSEQTVSAAPAPAPAPHPCLLQISPSRGSLCRLSSEPARSRWGILTFAADGAADLRSLYRRPLARFPGPSRHLQCDLADHTERRSSLAPDKPLASVRHCHNSSITGELTSHPPRRARLSAPEPPVAPPSPEPPPALSLRSRTSTWSICSNLSASGVLTWRTG